MASAKAADPQEATVQGWSFASQHPFDARRSRGRGSTLLSAGVAFVERTQLDLEKQQLRSHGGDRQLSAPSDEVGVPAMSRRYWLAGIEQAILHPN